MESIYVDFDRLKESVELMFSKAKVPMYEMPISNVDMKVYKRMCVYHDIVIDDTRGTVDRYTITYFLLNGRSRKYTDPNLSIELLIYPGKVDTSVWAIGDVSYSVGTSVNYSIPGKMLIPNTGKAISMDRLLDELENICNILVEFKSTNEALIKGGIIDMNDEVSQEVFYVICGTFKYNYGLKRK